MTALSSTSAQPVDQIILQTSHFPLQTSNFKVCAWPNLTLMPDGSVVATIFNRPYHGLGVGDVECWSSRDGRLWEKRGSPAVHEGQSNRMNVAAGLAHDGSLVVLASGWGGRDFRSNRIPQHQRYHMGAVRWVLEKE